MAMLYALMAICFFGNALAELAKPGPCPKVETMRDFDISKYMGRWYDVKEIQPPAHNATYKCASMNYAFDENGDYDVVWTSISRGTGHLKSVLANFYVPDNNNRGKFRVIFTHQNYYTDRWILATDYVSYGIEYDCLNNERSGHTLYLYLVTRDQNPTDAVLAKGNEVIKEHGFNPSDLTTIKQDDCLLKPDHWIKG